MGVLNMAKLARTTKRTLPASHSYKVGETVRGRAVVPSKNGKEESGLVIYKRKAEYRNDPYGKNKKVNS